MPPAACPALRRVLVLIADIVNSRDIPRRKQFQTRLATRLAEIARERPRILSPYTITLGDEFQAVLTRGEGVMRDFYRLQAAVQPHRVRLAIGIGALSTPINRAMAIGMDGPAFHSARLALDELKSSGGLLRAATADRPAAEWLNPVLALLSHQVAGWRGTRIEIVARLIDREEPAAIARALRLTPAAVYKSIQVGGLRPVVEMARIVDSKLERLMG